VLPVDPHPISVTLVGGQEHFEVPVGINVEFVDQFVCRGDDPVHRLQPHVSCGAAVSEQSVALTAAHRGTGVDAVRALHPPGHDVVGAGAHDTQDRIRIEAQRLVDARRQ
jgi:hypothetical protein